MSLLMDALKKAEQAKRRGQEEDAGPPVPGKPALNLELAPLDAFVTPAAATPATGLPDLPTRLEILDDEFPLPPPRPSGGESSTASTTAPPPTAESADLGRRRTRAGTGAGSGEAQDGRREAARNVFQVKQATDANRLFPVAVGTFSLIAVAIIALYFWLQLRNEDGNLQIASPAPAQPVTRAPGSATTAKPVDLPVVAETPAAPPPRVATPPSPRPAVVEQRSAAAPAADPIRITTARLQINPALLRGYQAFAAGDLETSRGEYEQLLKTEPKNGEALLALAAISLRQGQAEHAEEYYRRALEADPGDALAEAGLIALRGDADPVPAESRLKSLIAAQPAQPALHLALGNLYARQDRWNEAQQAYFKAYTADPENPDVIFNLAVSLDRLRQPALAAQYYHQALSAAANRQPGFDTEKIIARLRDLAAQERLGATP